MAEAGDALLPFSYPCCPDPGRERLAGTPVQDQVGGGLLALVAWEGDQV